MSGLLNVFKPEGARERRPRLRGWRNARSGCARQIVVAPGAGLRKRAIFLTRAVGPVARAVALAAIFARIDA